MAGCLHGRWKLLKGDQTRRAMNGGQLKIRNYEIGKVSCLLKRMPSEERDVLMVDSVSN